MAKIVLAKWIPYRPHFAGLLGKCLGGKTEPPSNPMVPIETFSGKILGHVPESQKYNTENIKQIIRTKIRVHHRSVINLKIEPKSVRVSFVRMPMFVQVGIDRMNGLWTDWSSDGTLLLRRNGDHIYLFNIEERKYTRVATMGCGYSPNTHAFFSSTQRFVVVINSTKLRFFTNVGTNETIQHTMEFPDFRNLISGIVWSRHDEYIAVGFAKHVKVFHMVDQRPVFVRELPFKVKHMVFQDDNLLVVREVDQDYVVTRIRVKNDGPNEDIVEIPYISEFCPFTGAEYTIDFEFFRDGSFLVVNTKGRFKLIDMHTKATCELKIRKIQDWTIDHAKKRLFVRHNNKGYSEFRIHHGVPIKTTQMYHQSKQFPQIIRPDGIVALSPFRGKYEMMSL